MLNTRITIIDAALVRLGAKALQSESARAAPSRLMEYEAVVGAIFSSYPWGFATRTVQLGATPETPPRQWSVQYQLPADMTGPPRAVYADSTGDTPLTDYELATGKVLGLDAAVLWCSEAAVWVRYTAMVDVRLWPGYFKDLVIRALMSAFALSVREDRALQKSINDEVYGSDAREGDGGLMAQARLIDAQSRPAARLGGGLSPLVDIRRR